MSDEPEKILSVLREQGAYMVLATTAKFMHDELAEWHRKNGRPDLAEEFQKRGIELSHFAHKLLFP